MRARWRVWERDYAVPAGQELRPRITAAWRLPLETRLVQGKNEVAAVLPDIGIDGTVRTWI